MKKILLPLSSIIFGAAFVACESESIDGDWEPMKWETNVPIKNEKHIIEVPISGNTYIFKCKNYTSFWVYALHENGKNIPINPEDSEIVTGEWYSINIKDNTMTVSISSNNNDYNQILNLGIQAGNAFDSFLFEQNAIKK